MATELLMPKLGLTMTEGTIDEWKKKEGDAVQKGEILYSVATDKLTNDVESDADGVLLKILVAEGETVPCKTLVGWIGAPGEAVPDGAAPAASGEVPAPAAPDAGAVAAASAAPVRESGAYVPATPYAKKLAKEKGFDLAQVPATGYKGVIVAKDVLAFTPAAAAAAAPAVKASPLAAKVAADLGIDLSAVNAHGRVLAQDILAYLESTREKAEPAAADAREETKPMSGMRKAIARNMLASVQTSPTVTFNLGIDMSEMKRYREQLKAKEIKVSYTDLLVKFVSKALTEFPLLNCSVEDNKIIYKHYVNMGVAVALDNGLVVPNIQDADKKSLTEISAEVKELAKIAREGQLPPREAARRHLHDHQPRHVRDRELYPHHQPARGRDPRREHHGGQGRRGGRRNGHPPHHESQPYRRPPRGGRFRGRAVPAARQEPDGEPRINVGVRREQTWQQNY